MKYKGLLERNLKLAYFRGFFEHLIFVIPIWYAFETRFVDPVTLGFLVGLSQFVQIVLELPTGALADLWSRRVSVFVGLLIYGAGGLFASQAKSAWWLWVAYASYSIAGSLISGASTALYYDSLKELKREKDFAKVSANQGLPIRAGLVISSLLGGFIYAYNFRLPYIVWGVSVLIAAIFMFFHTEPRIDTEKFTLKSYVSQTKAGFRELFKNNYMKDFSLYYLLVGGIGWYFVYFLGIAYITNIGISDSQKGIVVGVSLLIGSVLNWIVTRKDWLRRSHVYLGLPILLAIGLLPGAWVGRWFAVVAFAIVQFVFMARFSLLDQYANKEFESKYRATAISSLNMAVSLFFVFATAIGGRVLKTWGPSVMMTVLGVITLITTVPMAFVLIQGKRRGKYERV